MKKSVRDYDKGEAATFDKIHFSGSVGEYFARTQQAIFNHWIPRNATVLDVGTGTGRISIALAKRGHRVVGIDASEKMLARARSKAKGVKIRFKQGDARKLPFKKKFDVVLSSRVLMHVKEWRTVIKELCRVADMVIIDAPPTMGVASFDTLKKNPYRTFTVVELEKEFQRNGFHVDEIKKQFVLPYALHRKVNNLWFTKGTEGILRVLGVRYFFGAPIIIKAVRS